MDRICSSSLFLSHYLSVLPILIWKCQTENPEASELSRLRYNNFVSLKCAFLCFTYSWYVILQTRNIHTEHSIFLQLLVVSEAIIIIITYHNIRLAFLINARTGSLIRSHIFRMPRRKATRVIGYIHIQLYYVPCSTQYIVRVTYVHISYVWIVLYYIHKHCDSYSYILQWLSLP